MIGCVIVAHGNIGSELLAVLMDICGKQDQMTSLGVDQKDDPKERRQDLAKKIKAVDRGDGVILFTDLFGGTPSNLALSVASEEKVEVIAGVNLPMLIEFERKRSQCGLKELSSAIQEAGRKQIQVASALLGRECA